MELINMNLINIELLLSENVNVSDWCNEIIKKQENFVYNSLTTPSELNHIVKSMVQDIINYLKSQGKTKIEEINDNLKFKEALNILISYLKTHEVWKPSKDKPLTNEELEDAYNDLCITKYSKVDRKFNDPPYRDQNYALFSFNPSSNAQPDSDGFYGYIKIRGTFSRLEQAEERSKELIQYFSANQIFICEVGVPTPLQKELPKNNVIEVENPNKPEELLQYDPIRPKETLKYENLIKDQSLEEKKKINEIKQREEYLRADVAKNPNNKEPLEIYLELNQKRATASYLYTQHKEKLEEMKKLVISSRKQISDMDEKHPELKDQFMDHYNESCKNCGIDKCTDDMAVMIKNYFGEDTLKFDN